MADSSQTRRAMRSRLALPAAILALAVTAMLVTAPGAVAARQGARATFGKVVAARYHRSAPLRVLAATAASTQARPDGLPRPVLPPALRETGGHTAASLRSPVVATPQMPSPAVSFDGISGPGTIIPPDTNGDVGPNHYVQSVNIQAAVYSKTGALLLGPVNGNTFFTGLGGPCATTNDGDPVVLYDPLADRWIYSQFALPNFPNGPFSECIAVSTGPDPTGSYNQYEFVMPFNDLNDYPKLAVWPNGYFATFNLFTAGSLNFDGVAVFAFDRSAMLAGSSSPVGVYTTLNTNHFALLASDVDGLTPPPSGSPNVVMELDTFNDLINVWEFDPDYGTPSNSTFNSLPDISIPAVDGNLCNFSLNCIPQPGAPGLDAIGGQFLHRLAYRNFGSFQSIVANATVDVGGDHAGVLWFELGSTGGNWSSTQSGVFAPDSDHRWMGSIAQDATGDIAVGYSVSGAATNPSIRWAGRLVTDPAGTLGQGEATAMAGGGVQTDPEGRWGDYSAMSVDPTDDCTFWYTQEYYPASSARGWHTRIASFSFPECLQGGGLTPTTTKGKLKGSYDKQGKYFLYHPGDKPKFKGTVNPPLPGEDITFRWEKKKNGKWKLVAEEAFAMKSKGSVTVVLTGVKEGVPYRIKAIFEGDATHLPSESPFRFFKAKD